MSKDQILLPNGDYGVLEWEDFPPTIDPTYTYVVCQSGEGEHRFWSNDHGWTDLDNADHFTIDDVHTHGETPVSDGFWMDYQRAMEVTEQ